ncbi:MAG TPA: hypothetical protein VLM05_11910 [Mycobacteriales bacterium]|nr:hypothetical protein [Mycobacteriales bacterium]
MIAIVTVLVAFPLGFVLRNRLAAYVAYVAVFGYAFSFQNVYLLRSWVQDPGEGAFPRDADRLPVSYLLVSVAIYAAGFGLVTLGHRLGSRRRARTEVPVPVSAGS